MPQVAEQCCCWLAAGVARWQGLAGVARWQGSAWVARCQRVGSEVAAGSRKLRMPQALSSFLVPADHRPAAQCLPRPMP